MTIYIIWTGCLIALFAALYVILAVILSRFPLLHKKSALIALLLTAMVAGYGVWEARQTPEIVEIDIPIANLPQGLQGFRIVQISDTHFGDMLSRSDASRIATIVNQLKPDMVVHTGDVVDSFADWSPNDFADLGLIKAPYGKFFCEGNHDHRKVQKTMLTLGFLPLNHNHRLIKKGEGRLLLTGLMDIGSGPINVKARPIPKHDASVLIAHNPKAVNTGYGQNADLTLAGHTHGGQVFPFTKLLGLFYPYVSGLYKVGKTTLYVSRGTGYWGPPIRIGCKPEITVVKRVKAK